MAVIVLDSKKNSVTVLVEKTDSVRVKEGNNTIIQGAGQYTSAYIFVNGEVNLCMIRGERE